MQVAFESGYGPSLFEQRGGIDFSLVFHRSPFHDRAEGRLCIIEGVTHVAVQSVAVLMYASALWAYIPQGCCTPLCVLAGGDRRTAVVIGQFQPATVQVDVMERIQIGNPFLVPPECRHLHRQPDMHFRAGFLCHSGYLAHADEIFRMRIVVVFLP